MSRYTPEEIAAAQAAIRSKPQSAVIVEAPYDGLITVDSQAVARGTRVWRYVGGRQAGGPMDAHNANRSVEYSYRTLESARRLGWED